MLKTFTGFKGKVAFAQIGSAKFAILAKNTTDLAVIWRMILPGAEELDPAGIKSAILIEASTLPTPKGLHNTAQGCEPRATLGTPVNQNLNPEGVASSIDI